ncbi:MAG: carboxypeptidase regulatory-like domain-containing protein [Firmicutes bacterium]|nr:carboxypeptidase regulatory-like domain-containing protein [Bacillota bacterium]
MSRSAFVIVVATVIFIFSVPLAAFGHGVDIEYQTTKAVGLTARYDTGEPVSNGQVTIYAPGNPSTPWQTGQSDENGRFTFTPDPSKTGTWDIQVRKAGHGGMIHVNVDGEEAVAGSTGYTTSQIVLMVACVVWGSIGTALFFKRRKN